MTARREAPRLEIIRMLRSGATRIEIAKHFRIKPARVDQIARQLAADTEASATAGQAAPPRRQGELPAPLRLSLAFRTAAARAEACQKPLVSCTSGVKDHRET